MTRIQHSTGDLSRNGVYLLATGSGDVRALIDERLAARVPGIRRLVEQLGPALTKILPGGVAVSLRFEPAPVQR